MHKNTFLVTLEELTALPQIPCTKSSATANQRYFSNYN